MTDSRRQFASDNYSGASPEVMAAIEEANRSHAPSYGADAWTARATELIQQLFERECDVYFVFNGTAANALSLASLCEPFNRVICYAHSHLVCDECGAPGFVTHGLSLQGIPAPNGKLTPDLVEQAIAARTDIHHNKTAALSITQATELGTVYTPDEINGLRRVELPLHVDGARIANAIASVGCAPKEMVAGVDVLSLGGTKNGMIAAEAVVFFNRDLGKDFEWRRKQACQLSSKMRFIAAQWIGALESGAWLRQAKHANAMAERLEKGVRPLANILYPRQANAVFAALSSEACQQLWKRGWKFYNDVGPDGAARFMCSWDTTETDVDDLVKDIAACVS